METQINKYTLIKEIGRGAYGSVYLAKYSEKPIDEDKESYKDEESNKTEKPKYSEIVGKETIKLKNNTNDVGSSTDTSELNNTAIVLGKNKKFAVKKIKNERRFQNASQREIEYLKKLNNNNFHNAPIIKLVDTFIDNRIQYLVFEHMEINMYKYYTKYRLKYEHVIYIFYQLCIGFKYIHSQEIIHGDLKPENIMLNSKTGQIKIIDFGSSFSVGNQINNFYMQSRYYRAPELCYRIEASTAIDIWSIGCVIYELFFRRPLFPAREARYELIYLYTTLLGVPINIPKCQNTYFYSPVFNNQFIWNQETNTYFLRKYYPDDLPIDSQGLSKKLDRKFGEIYPNVDATEIINVLGNIITYDYTERSNATEILKSSIFHRYSIEI